MSKKVNVSVTIDPIIKTWAMNHPEITLSGLVNKLLLKYIKTEGAET